MVQKILFIGSLITLCACGDQRDNRMHENRNLADGSLTAVDVEYTGIELDGQGLADISGDYGHNPRFGAERSDIEAFLASRLGDPVNRTTNQDCGAGAMDMTEYTAPFIANFQDGKFVGWFLREGDTVNSVRLAEGIGLENSVNDLKVVFDVTLIEASTLGNEFTTSEGIGGILDEKSVGIDALYAGTNCFFR